MSYAVMMVGTLEYDTPEDLQVALASLVGEVDETTLDLVLSEVKREPCKLTFEVDMSIPASLWSSFEVVAALCAADATSGFVDCMWLEDEPYGSRLYAGSDEDVDTPQEVLDKYVEA